MDLLVRKAIIDDLKDIQFLNNKLFKLEYDNFDSNLKVGWSLDDEGYKYFYNLISNQVVYVAICENKVVGYLAGSIVCESSYLLESCAELENIFLEEEYRSRGIGEKLFAEFKKDCLENNVKKINVTASSKNFRAQNFYKNMGFSEYNTVFQFNIKKD